MDDTAPQRRGPRAENTIVMGPIALTAVANGEYDWRDVALTPIKRRRLNL